MVGKNISLEITAYHHDCNIYEPLIFKYVSASFLRVL